MNCPVCNAANNTEPFCRRCRADLSLLIKLEHRRTAYLSHCHRHARQGDWSAVLAHAESVHSLRRDADSVHLLALGCMMQGDFAKALSYLNQAD